MLVGKLNVSIAGHAATVDFSEEHGIAMRLNEKSSALSLRKLMPSIPQWMVSVGVELGIPVSLQLGNWKPVELLPQPSWVVRLLYPQLKAVPVRKR